MSAASPPDSPRFRAEFALVALLFISLGWLRLNDLCYYTPDSARYLIWGNSIARGEGWLDDTGPEPLRYVVHAPLYPALISPVERLFPMGTVEVKAYTLFWGTAALLFLYLWLFRLFGRIPAMAGALMLALNPGFLVYSTEVLSEAPFIAFFLLILWLMARQEETGELSGSAWWSLLAAASLIGLLREVGIAVASCAALRLWFTDRKKAIALLACTAAALSAWYVRNSILVGAPPGSPGGNVSMLFRHVATGPDGPFLVELAARISSNASAYMAQIGGMGFYPFFGPQHMLLLETTLDVTDAFRLTVYVVLGGLMALGLVRSLRSGKGGWLPAAAGAGLLLAASVYPVRDARFMAPLLPLMIMFLLAGAAVPGRRGWLRALAIGAAAIVVILPNWPAVDGLLALNRRYNASPEELRDSLAARGEYPYYYMQPWDLLRGRLDTVLAADAVLATPAKELALISGGRKVLELDPGVSQSVFDRLLRANNVTWLLSPARWSDMQVYEPLMTNSRRAVFTRTVSAGNLHMYRVGYRPFDAPPVGTPADTLPGGAAHYLRAARRLIGGGRYAEASALLDSAMRAGPARPEILADEVAAASLGGDSAAAAEAFLGLTRLPQAGSFIAQAERHVRLSGIVREVSALPRGPERSMRLLDASRNYWEMGFYEHARALLSPEMSEDTAFFVGHLWDFHYNFQTGDTAAARRSLRRLDAIDDTNSLVRNFHTLMDLRKAVRRSADPRRRSALRVRMAEIYRDIELYDEAFDQAHEAVADDSTSPGAALLIADLYAKVGYPRRALPLYRAYLALVPADSAARDRADSLASRAIR